ncbi:MAG: hypothetical protein HUJ28_07120 [Chromatiales bacterium]|nr:hypothetical protein [Chromatiales bacterium]
MKGTLMALGLMLLLAACDDPRQLATQDLPWVVESLADGGSRVFGVTLGESDLRTVAQTFRALPEIALFREADGGLYLEAYFGRITLGVLEARVIARLAADEAQLAAMADRAPNSEPMPSGARKLGLTEADIRSVYDLPVGALTYIPTAQYDAAIVEQRFGPPAETLRLNNTQTYWLYPDKGLALLLGEEEREVLEYVPPRDFPALRERLQQTVAGDTAA